MKSGEWKVYFHSPLFIFHYLLAGLPGIEPGNGGFKGPCLTAWLQPKNAFLSTC